MSSTTSPNGKILPQILRNRTDKLTLSSGADPPLVDLVTRDSSASSASMSFSDSEPAVQDGADPDFADLVPRENSAYGDPMSYSDWEPAVEDAQSLRKLLPKPGMDMAEHVRRLSPIDSEEDGEPDLPINPKDLQLSFYFVREAMRKALPPGSKIMVEAKKDMQRYVSEFISFITSEAAEKVYREHRGVIQGSDILVAMDDTGFERYASALRPYLVALLENASRTESPVSEAKDEEDTNAAAVQDGESTESFPWDHALGPVVSTTGDLPDTSVPSSSSTFPWVYPWVPKD